MEIKPTFGLAIFMPHCSFLVEMDRSSIDVMVNEIEKSLNDLGIDSDDEIRVVEVMQNALDVSYAMANDEIEGVTAVNELAYAFMYAYLKQIGEVKEEVRGVIGLLTEDYIHFNTCLEQTVFEDSVNKARSVHEEAMGGDVIDKTPARPTVH